MCNVLSLCSLWLSQQKQIVHVQDTWGNTVFLLILLSSQNKCVKLFPCVLWREEKFNKLLKFDHCRRTLATFGISHAKFVEQSKGRNKKSNISTTQALSRETVKVKIDLLLMLDTSILFLPFVTNKNKRYFFGTEPGFVTG